MFQKLNSMFVADSSSNLNQEPELTVKEDDEWIVVDFIVDTCTKTPEEATTFEEITYIDESLVSSYTSDAFERFGTSSGDSSFIHFSRCPMEESWFVTPPPCFTAGELTTIEVETSPMENLLIEHPSMSVYAAHNICNKPEKACDTESEFHNCSNLGFEAENKKNIYHRIHCFVQAFSARTSCLDQTKPFHCTTFSKRPWEKTFLNRKSLRRQNLVRGCHSHQVKHSGLLVQQPCQRRYNY